MSKVDINKLYTDSTIATKMLSRPQTYFLHYIVHSVKKLTFGKSLLGLISEVLNLSQCQSDCRFDNATLQVIMIALAIATASSS